MYFKSFNTIGEGEFTPACVKKINSLINRLRCAFWLASFTKRTRKKGKKKKKKAFLQFGLGCCQGFFGKYYLFQVEISQKTRRA